MQGLQYLYGIGNTVFYKLVGNDSDVSSYVVSHPSTREILTNPNIQGGKFLELLREASTGMLTYFPDEGNMRYIDEDSIAVHSTLRGGLNWDIKGALYTVSGKNVIHSMSSCQRHETVTGTGDFTTIKTGYDRTIIPDNANIIFPDIIATGITSKRMLKNIIRTAKRDNKEINSVVFITIGADCTGKMAEETHNMMSENFNDYRGTTVVFHEGVFTLVGNDSPVTVKQPGTDFLKLDALLAPEYVIKLYGNDSKEFAMKVLTPCVIGDGFSRGNHKQEYFHELLDYWEKEMALANDGVTLLDEMESRWPEHGFDDLEKLKSIKSKEWEGVDHSVLKKIHDLHVERWGNGFRNYADSSEALKDICGGQIELLGG